MVGVQIVLYRTVQKLKCVQLPEKIPNSVKTETGLESQFYDLYRGLYFRMRILQKTSETVFEAVKAVLRSLVYHSIR